MKRIILIALCMGVILFTGCTKEKYTSIELYESTVTLHSMETYQINAESEFPITYRSEDEFHAKVDENGLVTAGFVGETEIILSNGTDSKRVKIIVSPQYNLYSEPVLDFGITKQQLISILGDPDIDDGNSMVYTDYDNLDVSPMVMYLFENSSLIAVIRLVNPSYVEDLMLFLLERYYPLSNDVFVNGLTQDSINMSVVIGEMDVFIAVTYMRYDDVKSVQDADGIIRHIVVPEF